MLSYLLTKIEREKKDNIYNLLNSSKYSSLALPHLKRLELYKEYISSFVKDLIKVVDEIFIGKLSLKKQQQEIIFSYIRNVFDKEEENVIQTEKTFLAQRGMKDLNFVISNKITTIFTKAYLEFRKNIISNFEKSELNDLSVKIKKRKERLSELLWKIITYTITFLLGAGLGYLLKK